MEAQISLDNGNSFTLVSELADEALPGYEDRLLALFDGDDRENLHALANSHRGWIEQACLLHLQKHGTWPVMP